MDTTITEDAPTIVLDSAGQPPPVIPPVVKSKRPPSQKKIEHLQRLNERRTAEAKVRAQERRLQAIEARGRARYEKLHALYGVQQPEEEASDEASQAPEPQPVYYQPSYAPAFARRPLQYAPALIKFV